MLSVGDGKGLVCVTAFYPPFGIRYLVKYPGVVWDCRPCWIVGGDEWSLLGHRPGHAAAVFRVHENRRLGPSSISGVEC